MGVVSRHAQKSGCDSRDYRVSKDKLSQFCYDITSPPEGLARYCFYPVSLHVCVFWYFISRLLEEISICNVCRILIGLYSINSNILTFIG